MTSLIKRNDKLFLTGVMCVIVGGGLILHWILTGFADISATTSQGKLYASSLRAFVDRHGHLPEVLDEQSDMADMLKYAPDHFSVSSKQLSDEQHVLAVFDENLSWLVNDPFASDEAAVTFVISTTPFKAYSYVVLEHEGPVRTNGKVEEPINLAGMALVRFSGDIVRVPTNLPGNQLHGFLSGKE